MVNIRVFLLLTALLLGMSIPAQERAAANFDTEILWDSWGVPHIYAEDIPGLFYAYGWAQMHNHADLILQLYGRVRGEGAAYWGRSYLESDMQMHTLGVPDMGQQHYSAQNADFRTYIDAFAAGMNAYAEAHPDAIADTVKPVLPVRSTDPLSLAYYDVTISFVASSAVGAAQAWTSGELGSNAWAVAPGRSASGHAMLLANPHLPWSDIYTLMEAQLVAPGVDIYGASLIGLPVLLVGFNESLGWSHTVNMYDGFDLYELALTEDGYLLDGGTQAFETEERTIQVLETTGSLAAHTFQVLRSVHGPVISQNRNGQALAFRVVDGSTHMLEQWWRMGTASNLSEFEAAMAWLQIPMFNTVYADVEGNIYYVFNGQIPVREQGDYESWQEVQAGDASSLIWTTYHPFEELPSVTNPATGFLQSANEPPWTSTDPPALNIADFPSYFAPQGYWVNHGFRSLSSLQMLVEDESITFEELLAYKHSTHVEAADHVLDDLIAQARESSNATLEAAAEVLENWDRTTDANSTGALLFTRWFERYTQRSGFDIFAVDFDINNPFSTPSGLSDPITAVATLRTVADHMLSVYGTLDVPYGEVMRLRVGEYDLPGNGGGDPNGIFRAAWYSPSSTGNYHIVGGDTWTAAIEFSQPYRAQVVLPVGNATQPGSPHVGDQLSLFSEKRMRDAWITREAVEANLELYEVVQQN